jgi:hypothetical protein
MAPPEETISVLNSATATIREKGWVTVMFL